MCQIVFKMHDSIIHRTIVHVKRIFSEINLQSTLQRSQLRARQTSFHYETKLSLEIIPQSQLSIGQSVYNSPPLLQEKVIITTICTISYKTYHHLLS